MERGEIRDWSEDTSVFFRVLREFGYSAAKRAQARFRRDFTTPLLEQAAEDADVLGELAWGAAVELPDGLSTDQWTKVTADGTDGFVLTDAVVRIAHVGVDDDARTVDNRCTAPLRLSSGDEVDLLWGDVVQVVSAEADAGRLRVRARGFFGTIDEARLTDEPLLELYIIDVGQGDGVLIRFPDGRHMMIDGGLERQQQMTGKNAADFVDWKFFKDYGGWQIELDWMIASHSDADHYGGLEDLVSRDAESQDELDCLGVAIGTFGHPGLSRFPTSVHRDKLGPRLGPDDDGKFVRLMGDRADARALVDGSGDDGLRFSRSWRGFISAILDNDDETSFTRIGLSEQEAAGADVPSYIDTAEYSVKTLSPVTTMHAGEVALPDLGDTGKNTNGHSVCLRVDYKKARFLMTGDLNSKSMKWLSDSFDQHMDEWACDVAKACHHGSHDVSFPFLEAIEAGATIISSGDSEGYAHPRPQVVAASALSGHRQLTDDGEQVITPLVYMTEVERGVHLGEVNRVELHDLDAQGQRATVLAKPLSEFRGREAMSTDDWEKLEALPDDVSTAERNAFIDAAVERSTDRLGAVEQAQAQLGTSAMFHGCRPTGVVGLSYVRKSLSGMRIMEKNVYGLVNVRTDGETIMCASRRDDGGSWSINVFEARF